LGMIRNPDGSIAHGLNEYATLENFRRQLEQHLRDELIRFLRESTADQRSAPVRESPDSDGKRAGSATAKQRLQSTKAESTSGIASELDAKPGLEVKESNLADLPYTELGETGKDEFGHWLRWDYHGVEQVFRWIPPGRFWMGSPETEPEHDDREKLRQLKLTRGFWLGDTAVTQALWTAVMAKNPSEFPGGDRPVERVSWDDVQQLLNRMHIEYPGIPFGLPTEVEWEYACRAGTRTPFSFGWNITPAMVNYDGRYPYDGGAKGQYREQTVTVKTLPPNPWGLFEMHGNVWEWCADGLRDFGKAEYDGVATDPEGPEDAYRVVRGGSWISRGRNVRSACRPHNAPDDRGGDLGFRLALRGPVQSSPEGR
ncbi:MAG: formylglycine-generating enzyme family protein, partial [Wenzhouxiangellaceae bacterium]